MNLIPRHIIGELDLTDWPFAIIQGASDYGAPQNVAEVVDSMIQDGEIVSSTRASNRTMSHSVFIEEADMDALAAAEQALMFECDKQRNTWTIDPGDGFGAVTVFDIFRVQMAFVHDDDWEWYGYRRYDLTFPALPFGRSEDEVIDAALTSGAVPSTVTIQDGSSATNWTGTSTVTSSGGTLRQTVSTTRTNPFGSTYVVTARAVYVYAAPASIDFSATNYLSVEYTSSDLFPQVTARVDGSELTLVAVDSGPSGLSRATFLCADASASLIEVTAIAEQAWPFIPGSHPTVTFQIDNLVRSNVAPVVVTTGRELLRTITVQGSAPTEGQLAIGHETAGLGDVILYTGPAGGAVDLRRFRTSGSTITTDAATVSGSREAYSASTVFTIPINGLPRGGYQVYLRARSTTIPATAVFTASGVTKQGSALLGSQSTVSDLISLGTSAWSLFPVGDLTLPAVDVPEGSTASVQITISSTRSDAEYDEAWLFYAGEGSALTVVSCGAGTPAAGTVHNRLWLDTPSLARSEAAVWVGTQADRSDAVFADVASVVSGWGIHRFLPGSLTAFLVTSGATFATMALSHYPRWHTHARNLS